MNPSKLQCERCTFINKSDNKLCEICFPKLNSEFYCNICLENRIIEMRYYINDCKHNCCRECLTNYINNLDNIYNIGCPFNNQKDMICKSIITEEEIEKLLDCKSYEKYELKKRQQSELLVKNRFNCLTPNCQKYFDIDQIKSLNLNNNILNCELCSKINCIKCKNLFENYFKALRHNCGNEYDVTQNTSQEIEELISNGVLMRCPNCKILLEKTDSGCQFIRCFFCKLDICWLTRQARWGPNGKGDISGGCKCGVDGKKCHPDCKNCH